ncbi:glycine betaine ABC transporter substrate-binding protein [Mycetocola lacteus]|uniref:Glycine betaine ABC transporter substrate-binding protein n=1 Tax=Mycetocola lacteus TaxID=76637 RepID=A0A3L7AVF8_9MICO|nr:glycine betaine ABC transporter substrate-binding protein [Mycetocola lacteus]RLP84164.1 glycine betaine ABC transporter substrate-binding protein [Mycetocola lacteus]
MTKIRNTKTRRLLTVGGIIAAGALALTGCSAAGAGETLKNGDEKALNIAVFNGWDEGIAASELWKAVLDDEGYDVKLTYADVVPVYTGISEGDYDLLLDSWLPTTHKDQFERFGDKLVDLGSWYDNAKLTIAVNEDAPIKTIDELVENADKFGNRIVGIEAGAGLTKQVQNNVFPDYKIGDKLKLVTSSTPAMLGELKAATAKGEDIAVTLWQPHWAYDAFPIRDLEDPKNSLGTAESVHSVGSTSFEKKFPEVAKRIKNFTMDDETLASLENALFNSGDGKPQDLVRKWMADNKEYVDSLKS